MGGVLSSSLSVERLQGAEVVSTHLKISYGSRRAELFSDGYLVIILWFTELPRVLSELSFYFAYCFIMLDFYICFNTYNIESSEKNAFSTVSYFICHPFWKLSSHGNIFFRNRLLSNNKIFDWYFNFNCFIVMIFAENIKK